MWIDQVAARDMDDGLYNAANLFTAFTIQQFEAVKQLHIILLIITIGALQCCGACAWRVRACRRETGGLVVGAVGMSFASSLAGRRKARGRGSRRGGGLVGATGAPSQL